MTDASKKSPTPDAIEALANKQVEARIASGKKVAATLQELNEARALVAELEDRYKSDYADAIRSTWTAAELASIGIEPLKPKRTRRSSPKASARRRNGGG